MIHILVLYYSRNGSTAQMARHVARGIEQEPSCQAVVRTVPAVSPVSDAVAPPVPEQGAPYATLDDLCACDGLALGSPTRFGNMAAPLKYFLDTTGPLWIQKTLNGKPAGVFTSTSAPSGGQESTLLTMMIPLLHHGMVLSGSALSFPSDSHIQNAVSGTLYGPSHWSQHESSAHLSADCQKICHEFGHRLARIALQLRGLDLS